MKKLPYDRQVAMEALFTGHGPTTFRGKEHNLSRAYLAGLALENAEMPGVILDRSNLYKAWLAGCNLHSARLVSADLQEANLRQADLRNCRLNNANLNKARLEGADLRGADMTDATLQGAFLDGAKVDGPRQFESVASLYGVVRFGAGYTSRVDVKAGRLVWRAGELSRGPVLLLAAQTCSLTTALLLRRVVKLSYQASNRSVSVIPAKGEIQKRLLSRSDLVVETLGFRLSPE